MNDLSPREFAREFGISPTTVMRAIREGRIPAYRPPGSRGFRVPRAYVERERERIAAVREAAASA